MKAYRSASNWEDETYSYFERIHSKNKARRVTEKAARATGREFAKFNRELDRKNKELRLGVFTPYKPDTLVCGIPASEFFDSDPEPYAA